MSLHTQVELWRELRHPGVVLPIGACFEPACVCVVSELMPVGSLYGVVHRQKARFRLVCSIVGYPWLLPCVFVVSFLLVFVALP